MGILDRFLTSNDETNKIWRIIQTKDEIDNLIDRSFEESQLLLKHSYSCGTSYMAKEDLERAAVELNERFSLSLVDVVAGRAVSRYAAEKLCIRHESPQVLILKNGKVIWHGSHFNVNAENILTATG